MSKDKLTENLKENIKKSGTWERLLYMVLFLFVFSTIGSIVYFLAIVQFIIVLFNNKANENIKSFSLHLTNYTAQVLYFLTHNEEEKPWPFGSWPRPKRYRSNLPKQDQE
jgi:hypothetical protein